jgi:hypothetical protein
MITTEAEWFESLDPYDLARLATRRVHNSRFRWLAAEWGLRIQQYLDPEDSLWLNAFVSWLSGTGPHPSQLYERRDLYPLGMGHHEWYVMELQGDNYIGAVRSAALTASSYVPRVQPPAPDYSHSHLGRSAAKRAAEQARIRAHCRVESEAYAAHRTQVLTEFCNQFRDVAGNPLRGVILSQECRTVEVVAMAQEIHTRGLFDLMPLLGDALEVAGCQSPVLLEHCRGPGPHVRGCWAIQLICGEL